MLAFGTDFPHVFIAKSMNLIPSCSRSSAFSSLTGLLSCLFALMAGGFRLQGAPPNDNFNAAQAISSASAVLMGTNTTGSWEPGEPAHAGSTNAATIWFRWTAPTTRAATVDTVGSDFDTVLAVYTGTALENLTLVAVNDDIEIGRTLQSCVRFTAQAGTTYYLALAGFEDASGTYALNLNAGNDLFADALVLTGASGTVTGQNYAASKEPGEPAHAGNQGGRSVWFRWTAPTTGQASFDTGGLPPGDTVLAAYTGTAVTNLQLVAADDDGFSEDGNFYGFYGPSRVVFNTVAGETYFLALDGKDGMALGFVLNWRPEPALPVITLSLTSTNLVEGDGLGPWASVSGYGVRAQWLRDGQPATNLPNFGVVSPVNYGRKGFGSNGSGATTNDQGTYRLLATNYAGSVLSDPVVVTVTPSALVTSSLPVYVAVATNFIPPALPGGLMAVPINWSPRGDEQRVSFSIAFDPAILTFHSVTRSARGDLPPFPPMDPQPVGTVLNTNQLLQGRLGVLITNYFTSGFSPFGGNELATLYFVPVETAASTRTPIAFVSQPVPLELRSTNNSVIPTEYHDGMVEILVAWKGDLFPQPAGDGRVDQQDFREACRRLARLDGTDRYLPVPRYSTVPPSVPPTPFRLVSTSESLRYDSWPLTNGGDGQLTLSDAVQTGRYAAGLDPLVKVVAVPSSFKPFVFRFESASATNVAPRQLRFHAPPARRDTHHEISIRMTTTGEENAVAFSISGTPGDWAQFPPGDLYNKSVRAGADLGNAAVFVNQTGFILIKPPGETFPAGDLELVRLLLSVPAGSGAPAGRLVFTDSPVTREVVNAQADVLPAVFSDSPLPYFHSLLSQRIESSSFRFQVTSETGRRYVLEASDNLRTWLPIATNTATSESLELQEVVPSGAGRRFYRLVSP